MVGGKGGHRRGVVEGVGGGREGGEGQALPRYIFRRRNFLGTGIGRARLGAC